MADIKTLQTRIALKHDTWAAWHDETKENQGANLVLLKGEIGFCEIPAGNAEATTAPTVLFKVGDGTTPFKTLKWASALAADVYSWAKASDVVLEGKSIKFVGAKNADGTDKKIDIPYVTDAEVKAITNPLTERIAAVEAKFSGDTSVEGQISGLKDRLDVVQGADTVEGSIAKALKDAKAHAESQDAALKTELQGYADQAETDAIAAAATASEAKVKVERERIDAMVEANAARDTAISDNATAIGNEKTAREEADALINAKFGAEYDKDNTVAAAIADAKLAGTNAAQAVVDLEAGQVTTNKNAIAANVEAIAANATAITNEATARENADNALSGRIAKVEAFFVNAEDADGNYTGLNDALDTLVEIQSFLKGGEGEEANGLFEAINANSAAIEALEGVVGDADGGLVKDMNAAEEAIGALEDAVEALETLTAGFAEGETVKAKIEAAAALGQTGIDNAATAQAAAEAAQGEVDALEIVVSALRDEYDVTAALANTNKEGLAAVVGRMDTAEADIDALEAIVKTGADKNEALRADITELQGIVKTGADANATLGTEIDNLAAEVHHAETGLAKTKEIADGAASKAQKNAEDIAAIQNDYLKMADLFIIDCGSSTTNIHERPQA